MTSSQISDPRKAAGRLWLAGIVAGLIMNIGEAVLHGGLLANATEAAYLALGSTAPADSTNLIWLIALTFAQGFLIAWLCGALRPRLHSRWVAAICAALAVWVLFSVYAAVYLHAGFPGLLPDGLVWWPVAWQLIEYPVAALAGAAVSRDSN